jgi:hypothetical protein
MAKNLIWLPGTIITGQGITILNVVSGLSVDPLADITVSPYAYVWNDPVNFADPTGLMGERVGGKKSKRLV